MQLGTVRYLGTFLDDPLPAPTLVLHTLARQLRVEPMDGAKPTARVSCAGSTQRKSALVTITSTLRSTKSGTASPTGFLVIVVLAINRKNYRAGTVSSRLASSATRSAATANARDGSGGG